MTFPLGGTPRTPPEWVRSVEQRLAALARPSTLRIGPWVLSALDGSLLATRPGQALQVGSDEPVTIDIGSLRGVATKHDVEAVAEQSAGIASHLEALADHLLNALGETPLGTLLDKFLDIDDALAGLFGQSDGTETSLVSGFLGFVNSIFDNTGASGTPSEMVSAATDIRLRFEALEARMSDAEGRLDALEA